METIVVGLRACVVHQRALPTARPYAFRKLSIEIEIKIDLTRIAERTWASLEPGQKNCLSLTVPDDTSTSIDE